MRRKIPGGESGVSLVTHVLTAALVVGVTTAAAATATTLRNSAPLRLEAEHAELSGVFTTFNDRRASGHEAVRADPLQSRAKTFKDDNAILFCFQVSEPGNYTIAADVIAPASASNSFYMRIDDAEPFIWEMPVSSGYQKATVANSRNRPVKIRLEPGQHVVGFYLREPRVRLDRIHVRGGFGVDSPIPCAVPGGGSGEPQSGPVLAPYGATAPVTTESPAVAPPPKDSSKPTDGSSQPVDDKTDPNTQGAAGGPPTTASSSATTTTYADSPTTTQPKTTTTTKPRTTTTTRPRTPTTTTTGGGSGSADGVLVRVGESIQAAVNAHPAGTTFIIATGVHTSQSVKPKAGNSFIGQSGAVMDGRGNTEYAFIAFDEHPADNVTIRGLEIKNYAPPTAMAAITTHRSGWVVDNCDVHHSKASGIRIHDGGVIRNSTSHHNEGLGLKPSGDNILVEDNDVYSNNLNWRNSPTFEAGGIKGSGNRITIRDNHVYDNNGHGIWLDENAINIVYERNLIEDNAYSGINHEISYDAVIRNNTIRRNGHGDSRDWLWGAGIQIKGPNVEIYGNVVENNKNGIALLETGRGSGTHGSYAVRNIYVHDNVIINSGGNGGVRSGGSNEVFTTSRFDKNTYRYSGTPQWNWNGNSGGWDFWRSQGQDPNGKVE